MMPASGALLPQCLLIGTALHAVPAAPQTPLGSGLGG